MGLHFWSQVVTVIQSQYVYTGGSGTIVIPSGYSHVLLEAYGPGGGGGGGDNGGVHNGGSGGGAGGYLYWSGACSLGQNIYYFCGVPGSGGACALTNGISGTGSSGTTTSITFLGNNYVASGGWGGGPANGPAGAGGGAWGGLINLTGPSGTASINNSAASGNTIIIGPSGGLGGYDQSAGSLYGGGGGGAGKGDAGFAGMGGSGAVIITLIN